MSGDARPRRIVVYRLGSLGDTVVALPCLHKVAQAYPDAERILLTNVPVSTKAAPLEAILGGSGLVHGYMSYPVGTRSLAELSGLRTRLRALGAETLVYLTPSRGLAGAVRDLMYFKLCGFRHVVGAPLSPDLQRHRRGADGLLERECERLARCMAPLGDVALDDPRSWDLRLSAAEAQAAANALGAAAAQPRIAINMGGKVARNDWGETNWRALVTLLRRECGGHALLFVGAAEDEARAARVGALWPGPVANLCGRVTPRVSAAAMAGARVFVGHDSGPLHLASSVGVPCVGLYGDNHEPRKWHPYGDHHRILHDMNGVPAIGVEAVARAVLAEVAIAQVPQAAAS
ncbi:MAG: glycosyltransferase family 9 protein [Rhizobiales bacterium]|nr:glycosyltransferase family 9 protein [Rhizobacter sp.]